MKYIVKFMYLVLVVVGIYYVTSHAIPKLIPTFGNYGDYFWPKMYLLFPHVILGVIAILIGPFQFVTSFRNKNLRMHRNLGRLYVICVVISGLLGVLIVLTTNMVSFAYGLALFMMSFFWTASGLMAYFAIVRKKIEQHKEWMIRSYTLTFSAFVITRLITDALEPLQIMGIQELLALSVWASWVIPLLLLEFILQGRKILTRQLS